MTYLSHIKLLLVNTLFLSISGLGLIRSKNPSWPTVPTWFSDFPSQVVRLYDSAAHVEAEDFQCCFKKGCSLSGKSYTSPLLPMQAHLFALIGT